MFFHEINEIADAMAYDSYAHGENSTVIYSENGVEMKRERYVQLSLRDTRAASLDRVQF